MMLRRLLIAVLICLAALPVQSADPPLLIDGKPLLIGGAVIRAEASSDPPILAIPSEQYIANGGAFSFTPTPLQGENLTYSFSGLSGWMSGDAETGEISGTAATGAIRVQITATNSAGSFSIWVIGSVYTSTGTISSADTFPLHLTTANKHWTITEDIAASGTALVLRAASNISVDGGGNKTTFDNATPISIANNGFETVDPGNANLAASWDFTAAPNCVRFAGALLSNQIFAGSYGLKFDCPTADDEYVESVDTITLEPNTTYALSCHVTFGNGTSTTNPSVKMYAQLVGTGAETTVEVSQSTSNFRGMQLIVFQFTTGAGTPTYNVRVGIENGAASSGSDVYIDRVRVQRMRCHGVLISPQSYNASLTPDVSSYGTANSPTIGNVVIEQGTDGGIECDGIFAYITTDVAIGNCTITVNGDDSHCVDGRDTDAKFAWLLNNTFTSNVAALTSRDNDTASVTFRMHGVIADCEVTTAPHTGFIEYSGPSDSTICRNTFAQQAKYTNAFSIKCGGNHSTAVYGNTINNGAGGNSSRGILGANVIDCHDNIVNCQDAATNQEYGGVTLGGAYTGQTEANAGGLITGETYTLTGPGGGSVYRLGAGGGAGYSQTGTLEIASNTFVCNVSANSTEIANKNAVPCLVKDSMTDPTKLNWHDNVMTTNCSVFYSSETTSFVDPKVLADCTWRYIDDGLLNDYPWITDGGYLNVTVRNPTYFDAGSKAYLDQQVRLKNGTGATGSHIVVIENEVVMTVTDGGVPIASTAIVITDSAATEFFNGTTNASGEVSFTAKEITWSGATRTAHNPYTITVTGYDPATATIDETDRTPTVPMTPE